LDIKKYKLFWFLLYFAFGFFVFYVMELSGVDKFWEVLALMAWFIGYWKLVNKLDEDDFLK